MLTTVDNPYDPFTEWDKWYQFDQKKGYNTPAFLARVTKLSPDLPDAEQTLAIEQAMDEIVAENVSGMHKKVSRDDFQIGGEGAS